MIRSIGSGEGEPNPEAVALTVLVIDLSIAPQGFGQNSRTKETKAAPPHRTRHASPVKSIEQPRLLLRRETVAAIVDFQLESPVVDAAKNLDRATGWPIFNGVIEKGREHDLEGLAIGGYRPQAAIDAQLQWYPSNLGGRCIEREHLSGKFVNEQRLAGQLHAAALNLPDQQKILSKAL